MNLLDRLKQQAQVLETSSGGDFESYQDFPAPRNPLVKLSVNKVPEIMVRIIPAREFLAGEESSTLVGAGYRKMVINYPKDGNPHSQGDTMFSEIRVGLENNPNSKLEQAVARYADSKQFENYGKYPGPLKYQNRYLVNFVRVVEINNVYTNNVDANGAPIVEVMDIPQSAYGDLLTALTDNRNVPSGADTGGLGMLSIGTGFPLNIQMVKNGNFSEYKISPYGTIALPPLPANMLDYVEDVTKLAYLTEDVAPNRTARLIEDCDSILAKAEGGGQVHQPAQTQYQAPVANTQPQYQAPVANTQPPVQPAYTPPAPVQQQQQQPVQQQQQPVQQPATNSVPSNVSAMEDLINQALSVGNSN